jgi:uncharacterized protein YifE (UPF0438 family)
MSEAAAPTAPAAPANTAPVEGQAAPVVTPEDPFAEYNAVLKAKPVKYKAAGKEREVRDMRELVRKAEKADAYDAKQQEIREREAKASEILELRERLKTSKSAKERVAILRELTGANEFEEAAEDAILERIEREKTMQGLSPTERAARQRAEELEQRLAAVEAEKQRAEQERQQQEESRELDALRNSLAGLAVKVLTAAKLPKDAAPDAVRRMAVLMARSQVLGHELAPEDLAGEAVKWAGDDFRMYTGTLDGEPLLEFLGEEVARRASKALLVRFQGGAAVRAVIPAPTTQPQTPTERRSPASGWRDLERGLLK